jgi:transglutaminase-like putative cysteine protease
MSVWTAERGGSRRDEPGYDEPGWAGRLAARMEPEEGWVSLPLVAILAATMAWSIADARWILGRDNLTSFVIWLAVAAAMWGYFSARLDMSPWLAHLLGAAIGAFLIIEAVGAEMPGAQPGLVGWFNATAESVTQAYLDLTWRHQISTTQYGHFCLIIGILVWGTAQAASFDIFGYHRSVTGVLLMAVLLVANMCLTYTDQFWGLVLFSAAALALLLKAHAAEERSGWLRHRIWRGGDFKAPHLEGGLGFASLSICGALLLTSVASSAPLGSAWSHFDPAFRDFSTWVSGYLPVGGQSRITTGADFGTSLTVGSSFRAGPDKIFTVRLPDQARTSKWRVATYDEFKSTGWAIGPQLKQISVPAGGALTAATADQISSQTPGRVEFRYVVHVQDTSLKHMIVANEPDSVNVQVDRVVIGSYESDRTVVWYPTPAQDYTVTAYIPDNDPAGKGLTEWRLRHAGTQYPASLLARYTQGVDFVGSDGRGLLDEIKDAARRSGVDIDPQTGRFANAYDAARAIQDYLRDGKIFTYNTDITDTVRKCAGLSTVDCFAREREGFCEHYATTMTMLMRLEGYPARYVVGFLPGQLEQHTLIEQVTAQQRHAWVEVFFPGYGWIPFDPTGGGVGDPTLLPVGSAVLPTPTPSFSVDPNRTVVPRRTPVEPDGDGSPATATTDTGFGGPLAPLLPVLVPTGVLAAVLLLWSRRPRPPRAPDTVYRGIVKLASRLGFRPHPTQTVYEYTGMLADVVPRARDPLGVVAMAEVEVVYGRRQLSKERLTLLQSAESRVRAALLGLVFRLPGHGRRPADRSRGRRPAGRP